MKVLNHSRGAGLEALAQKYEEEIEKLKEDHKREIERIDERHAEELEKKDREHREEMKASRARHEVRLYWIYSLRTRPTGSSETGSVTFNQARDCSLKQKTQTRPHAADLCNQKVPNIARAS